jgi:hypothetical protein
MKGFKGFRSVETIPEASLEYELGRLGIENRYIYWTGERYNGRKDSLRSNALYALKVVKEPVSLKEWIRLAARIVPETETGYHPKAVRAGLALHQGSKPVVFLELKKEDDGSYTSVYTPTKCDAFPGLKKGDVVIPAAKKEEPAEVEVRGKEIVPTGRRKPTKALPAPVGKAPVKAPVKAPARKPVKGKPAARRR